MSVFLNFPQDICPAPSWPCSGKHTLPPVWHPHTRGECIKLSTKHRIECTLNTGHNTRYWIVNTSQRKLTTYLQLSYCDYIWDNLAAHEHLPGLVCGVTGETLLHGQVKTWAPGTNVNEWFTYFLPLNQIKEVSLRVSAALQGLGLEKGTVVGALLPNCVEYPLLVQVTFLPLYIFVFKK